MSYLEHRRTDGQTDRQTDRRTHGLIREGIDFPVKRVTADPNGRYIVLQCYINDDKLILMNVYCPNTETEQVTFLEKLDEVIDELSITVLDEVIMGGDWNLTWELNLDKCGGNYDLKRKSKSKLKAIMTKLSLNDVWRIKNPNLRRFSWRQPNPLIQCRLDYFLISDSLYDSVTHADIIPAIRTDHSAITLSLEKIPSQNRGPNLWKFNTSLLKDDNYNNQMKGNLTQWIYHHNTLHSLYDYHADIYIYIHVYI